MGWLMGRSKGKGVVREGRGRGGYLFGEVKEKIEWWGVEEKEVLGEVKGEVEEGKG